MPTGRPPRPAHLRAVTGTNKVNPGRENTDAPEVPANEIGKPPKGMEKAAADIWKERALWWSGTPDRAEWTKYCLLEADIKAFRKILGTDRTKWFFETDKGTIMRHPASTMLREAEAASSRLAAAFGMNPTDRQRIKVKPKRKPSAGDEFRNKGRDR